MNTNMPKNIEEYADIDTQPINLQLLGEALADS